LPPSGPDVTIVEMARILVGTADGLHALDGGDAWPSPVAHAGRSVTAVAPEGWALWAILDGREIWHTAGIDWWFHVGDVDGRRGNCVADTRAGVLVGTSEAHLDRVAGEGLESVGAFERVEGRDRWYTPWGGPPDVRSISEDDEAVYVNVHVGGIVRSRDQGTSWEPTIDIDADVHRVWAGRDRVFAACAGGLAVSDDRGDSWTIESDGLHARYCRAVTTCGDTVLLSASAGPRGGEAALYRRPFAGGRLERCREGLPEWFDGNIDSSCLDAIPELAAFGTEDGRLFASSDEGRTWAVMASDLPSIGCVLVVP
jgi:hypothetical protein